MKKTLITILMFRWLEAWPMKKLLFLLFLALPSFGAIVVVEEQHGSSCYNASAVASVTCTFAATPTVGNTIAVDVSFYNFNNTITLACTDNQGNSYTTVVADNETTAHQAIAWCVGVANTSSGTFTVTYTVTGGNTYQTGHIWNISGLAASSVTDQTGTNHTVSSSPTGTVSTGGATTVANEIVLAAFAISSSSPSTAAGTGYTLGFYDLSTQGLVDEYEIVSSTGSQTAGINFSPTVSTGYTAAIITLKGATSTAKNMPPIIL